MQQHHERVAVAPQKSRRSSPALGFAVGGDIECRVGDFTATLVDDSPVVRMIETALLEGADYEVDAVADGQQALKMIGDAHYALLVTGIETRGLGGIDLARAARAASTNRNIAIVVVTSGDSTSTSEQARQLGITAFLPKGQEGQQQLLDVARALRESNIA